MDAPYRVHVSDAGAEQPPNEWAKLLREITDRPGWSVARLNRESGIHRSTIFRWLSGEVTNVTMDSIRLVAQTAGIDLDVAVRAASTLPATVDTAVIDDYTDPITGETYLDPDERALWDRRRLKEETRRGLIAHLRTLRSMESQRRTG